MGGPVKVTAMDVDVALEDRYRRAGGGYHTQVEVEDRSGLLRLDGVGLEFSYRRMWVSGFEVKVSRADFLRDAKWHLYAAYVDDLSLVCPSRMVDRDEIPDGFGLLWYEPTSHRLRWRRKPEPTHGDTGQVKDQLLHRLTRQPQPSRWGRYETARRYAEETGALKNIGDMLGTRMAQRLQQLERMQEPTQRRVILAKAELFGQVRDLLAKHGYDQLESWDTRELADPKEMGHRLERLDKALGQGVSIDAIDEETKRAIDTLQWLRHRVGLTEHGKGN